MAEKYYTENHEWIEAIEENKVRVGISEYAQEQLGDVVFVELPEVDDEFDENEDFSTVESVKSTSDVAIPYAGKIISLNENLEDEPELVNDSPEQDGWLVEFELEEDFQQGDLLDKDDYDDYLETL